MVEAFEIEDGVLIHYHGTESCLVIPEGVSEIGERAFYTCESLLSIEIPKNVRMIGEYAFACCRNLQSVSFSEGLEYIEACAFYQCTGLENIQFPDSLRGIESAAFSGCAGLTRVEIPGSVQEITNAFAGCSGLSSVVLKEGVLEIDGHAFVECPELLSVTLPASVTDIYSEAFAYCPKLTLICPEKSFAHRYCEEHHLPYLFDYQFQAFHSVIPTGLERLSSPFLADEEEPYIFISYSHRDRDRVLPILKTLYESGWKVWYDEGLTIGDQYDAVLESHVRHCAAVLLFMTENSEKSAYILENELPWAYRFGKPVIRCRLEEGAEIEIPGGAPAAPVSPMAIDSALSATAGLIRGEKRKAKGISVAVNPAARYETPGVQRSALCLYARGSEPAAKAVRLEAERGGCVFYASDGGGREERLLRISGCLVVFLDHAFLKDEHLTGILIRAWQQGKDMAVCALEEIEDADLPEALAGLHKMQWLDFAHGIHGDMIKKLVRHLEKRGCRNTAALPGFAYEKTKQGLIITRYTGREVSPWMEDAYGGIPVVEIGDEAFRNCITLRSLRLPDGIKKIGKQAFEGCTNLASIDLGSGLEEVDWRAFCGCTSLASVVLPESMKEIGEGAFAGCTGLLSAVIPERVKRIRGYAFSACVSLQNVRIPKSLKWIESAAFNECKALTSVVIPGTVSGIAQEAFRLCDHLQSVEIEQGVVSVGEEAFAFCEQLTSVHLPASIGSIGEHAFEGCGKVRVKCPEGSYAQKYCMQQALPFEAEPKERIGFWKRLFGANHRA